MFVNTAGKQEDILSITGDIDIFILYKYIFTLNVNSKIFKTQNGITDNSIDMNIDFILSSSPHYLRQWHGCHDDGSGSISDDIKKRSGLFVLT